MQTKPILWMGRAKVLACDGNCGKAWGYQLRPKEKVGLDFDDIAYLADSELGDAPKRPGTYEGGHTKPRSPEQMNKWCSRECERSDMASAVDEIQLPDWSKRMFNQPWKHQQPNTQIEAQPQEQNR